MNSKISNLRTNQRKLIKSSKKLTTWALVKRRKKMQHKMQKTKLSNKAKMVRTTGIGKSWVEAHTKLSIEV